MSRLAHAAFKHISHTQLAPDLFHVNGTPLVGKTRIAGDDEQPAHARQRRYDLLHDAVGEILLLLVAAQILEGKHGDRRFGGQRQFDGNGRGRAIGIARRRSGGGRHGSTPALPNGLVELRRLCLRIDAELAVQPVPQSCIELEGLGYLRLLGMRPHQRAVGRFGQGIERQ